MKSKLRLDTLKVDSFVTKLETSKENDIKGGCSYGGPGCDTKPNMPGCDTFHCTIKCTIKDCPTGPEC